MSARARKTADKGKYIFHICKKYFIPIFADAEAGEDEKSGYKIRNIH